MFLEPAPLPLEYTARRVSMPSDKNARRRWEAAQMPAPAPRWRVLVPEHVGEIIDAQPEQIPLPAARMAAKACAAGAIVRTTYSLAEGEDGLLSAVAVRVRLPDGDAYSRGWATWWNGQFNAAQWWTPDVGFPRSVGASEFAALVSGTPYVAPRRAEPVRGACPRCGALVRWKLVPAPATYAHTRTRISDGEKKPIKEKCE